MDQRRNQSKWKHIWDKWKQKHNLPKSVGYSTVLKKEVILINTYIKKKIRLQLNNLTLHLKELEKEGKTDPKASVRRKTTYQSENKYNADKKRQY